MVSGVAFSPIVNLIATSSDDDSIRIWDTQSALCIQKFTDHKNDTYSPYFSKCGRYVLSTSDDKTIKMWDL